MIPLASSGIEAVMRACGIDTSLGEATAHAGVTTPSLTQHDFDKKNVFRDGHYGSMTRYEATEHGDLRGSITLFLPELSRSPANRERARVAGVVWWASFWSVICACLFIFFTCLVFALTRLCLGGTVSRKWSPFANRDFDWNQIFMKIFCPAMLPVAMAMLGQAEGAIDEKFLGVVMGAVGLAQVLAPSLCSLSPSSDFILCSFVTVTEVKRTVSQND